MPRALVAGLVGVIVGAAIVLFVVWWLPGPRAALPSASVTAAASSSAKSEQQVGLPNGRLTPGSINPNVTADTAQTTICVSGWSSKVRPPSAYTSALKLAQIVEYGYADRNPSHYEEDHLVPLELGGAPRDPRNLWPEPNDIQLPDGTKVGADAKDALEDLLHAEVCSGSLALDQAQRSIAGNWIATWQAAGQP
jgi:hypothetical protein